MKTLQQLIDEQKVLIDKIMPLLPGISFQSDSGRVYKITSSCINENVVLCDVYDSTLEYLFTDTINVLFLLLNCTITKGSQHAATN